ncbi:hypothetical protein SAMN05880590_107151 [Rhizobium sp. RU35A]|uniref:hypothetical protein n=1 Tax=Rhizobium sp. RU35A TaxID=1907414 RepID=UPI00095630D7|nr:hypothetical protein [Rhizobium sp. RU35A]SIQ78133.1 hypothetical protein SAMN05880590_107151 [Rhizobium sp. RU35A]
MKEKHSEHSMLRTGLPQSEMTVSSIIRDTERHVRAMCRVMQVYEDNACHSIRNMEQDYQDLTSIFSAFYEYVDGKMDALSQLSDELEFDLSRISLSKLKTSEDFRRKPLSPEAFRSQQDYEAYLATFALTRDEHSRRER